jgi:hypothetical protein
LGLPDFEELLSVFLSSDVQGADAGSGGTPMPGWAHQAACGGSSDSSGGGGGSGDSSGNGSGSSDQQVRTSMRTRSNKRARVEDACDQAYAFFWSILDACPTMMDNAIPSHKQLMKIICSGSEKAPVAALDLLSRTLKNVSKDVVASKGKHRRLFDVIGLERAAYPAVSRDRTTLDKLWREVGGKPPGYDHPSHENQDDDDDGDQDDDDAEPNAAM